MQLGSRKVGERDNELSGRRYWIKASSLVPTTIDRGCADWRKRDSLRLGAAGANAALNESESRLIVRLRRAGAELLPAVSGQSQASAINNMERLI